MTRPKLTFACGLYERMVPLYSGDENAEGLDLDFIVIDGPRKISLDRCGPFGGKGVTV